MKKHKPSSQYFEFIKQRDQFLDRVHLLYRLRLSKAGDDFQNALIGLLFRAGSSPLIYNLTKDVVNQYSGRIAKELVMMKLATRVVSYGAGLKGLDFTTRKPTRSRVMNRDSLLKNWSNEDVMARVHVELQKIALRCVTEYESAIVRGEDKMGAITAAKRAFPKKIKIARAPRTANRLKEAKRPEDQTIKNTSQRRPVELTAFIDQDTWDTIMAQIKDIDIVSDRSLAVKYSDEYGNELYEWEIEKQAQQEFVDEVFSGDNEAMKSKGITDMVWQAVTDDKTDDCCAARDGMLVSEIRRYISTHGELGGCDGDVPPLHFNCRCRVYPVDDSMEDLRHEIDWQGFEDWLNG